MTVTSGMGFCDLRVLVQVNDSPGWMRVDFLVVEDAGLPGEVFLRLLCRLGLCSFPVRGL